MNNTAKLALIAALIALVGGSLFMPGPSEAETEQLEADWKNEIIKIAEKEDRHALVKAGAFTK